MPPLSYLTASNAAKLDEELMSTGAFTLDQLMELAGLSVAQAAYALIPSSIPRPRILIAAGPGNNGGDGLVAARHLYHFGCVPSVYYPKPTLKDGSIYPRLLTQLEQLAVPVLRPDPADSSPEVPKLPSKAEIEDEYDLIIDAVFGFSFKGEVRQPFPDVVDLLATTKVPVLAVDAPSSWDIDKGPREQGPGAGYMPSALISLTAPKPLVKFLGPQVRHFVGGRFLAPAVADKYGLDLPRYKGSEQIVEVPVEETGRL